MVSILQASPSFLKASPSPRLRCKIILSWTLLDGMPRPVLANRSIISISHNGNSKNFRWHIRKSTKSLKSGMCYTHNIISLQTSLTQAKNPGQHNSEGETTPQVVSAGTFSDNVHWDYYLRWEARGQSPCLRDLGEPVTLEAMWDIHASS